MDERFTPRPVARWYMIAAVVSVLLMLLPFVGALIHLTTDPATLPLDERAQFEAEPIWMVAAFGLTGLAGAIGGLMLVLRRKAAEPLLLIALVGIACWFAGLFVNAQLRDLLSTGQIAMALIVVAIVWTIYWFARHSRMRGWLR
jgi:magnesium-transporting ATPase (P-type)